MKIYTANKETGMIIEEVASIEEGITAIEMYNLEDEAEGIYDPNFYDLIDEDGCSIIS